MVADNDGHVAVKLPTSVPDEEVIQASTLSKSTKIACRCTMLSSDTRVREEKGERTKDASGSGKTRGICS